MKKNFLVLILLLIGIFYVKDGYGEVTIKVGFNLSTISNYTSQEIKLKRLKGLII